jgi:hypothetical protein
VEQPIFLRLELFADCPARSPAVNEVAASYGEEIFDGVL